jgi:spore photoproduct lyase
MRPAGKEKVEKWKPEEIIVNAKVKDDPVTNHVLQHCRDVPVKYVESGRANTIVKASETLKHRETMLEKILAGKKVLYISPAGNDVVDVFTMPDNRMMCPHFDRLKLASNGCFYQCDWCYLKLTYRAAFPSITIKTEYDRIKDRLAKRIEGVGRPVIFNSGEMADSLALDHLSRAGREFIPWFGKSENGYLFMLTKSNNVDDILDLSHNGHTIVAWSMNNAAVSRKYEIGAPTFARRLKAARKVQEAGYPLRIRLDPIVPFNGWKEAYADTIKEIFSEVSPERVTLGTLRFEKGFYNMRHSIFTSGPDLPKLMEDMAPMFSPKIFPGNKHPKAGKYSFSEEKRSEIFRFALNEIRKYSDCRVALCKESENVWTDVGLDLSRCSCVCQLDYAEMSLN